MKSNVKLHTRSRVLLPLILLLMLLTQKGYAQTLPESPTLQSSVYGIEPEQAYPGSLVLELMEMAEAEIDAAVSEAFAEGYKAAMLQYAPAAASYKQLTETLQTDLEAERKKNRYFWTAVGVSIGVSIIAGFFLGFNTGR